MTTIYLLRHGEVANPQNVLYGRLPRFRLSERGLDQAAAAAQYLRDRPLAAIFCSPMLRARQTASYVAAHHPVLKVRQTALLNEVLSPHQGRPTAELAATGWRLYENLPPGFEQPADILARALRWIRQTRQQHPDGEVAAVSHGDVVLALRFWATGSPPFDDRSKALTLYPATASITTLVFADGDLPTEMTYHRPY